MENNSGLNELLLGFSPANRNEWIQAAAAEIDGKNPLETLQWQKAGLTGLPYYDSENTPTNPFSLAPSESEFFGARSWHNLPKIKVLDPKDANQKALHYLSAGADGVLFELQGDYSLETLLNNIEWPYCSIGFSLESITPEFCDQLEKYLSGKKFDPTSIQGFILQKTYPHHPQVLHKLIHIVDSHKKISCMGISTDEHLVPDQISDLLVKAVKTIDQLEGEKQLVCAERIFFSINLSTDFIIEIAKLKVLRMLWHKILNAYGSTLQSKSILIHATCEAWISESFEPHGNLLKATTAGMAAILGGCTSITLAPADEADERLARIAQNISHILREESHINKVADPTAGSYYLEQLIRELSENAWKKFLQKVKAS
jgi:methylmalonyl-CoA mutase